MTTTRTAAEVGRANRRAGRELERAAQVALEGAGWFVLRTGPGQAGVVDLVALLGGTTWGRPTAWFVQCKKNGYLPPTERADLRELASNHGGRPVVATWEKPAKGPRHVTFRNLEDER